VTASPAAALHQGEAAESFEEQGTRSAAILSAALGGLLLWLVIQTPLATAAYQYLGLSVTAARAILIAKDALVAVLLVVLAVRYARSTHWYRFDVAALIYVLVLAAYAIVPMFLGSKLPLLSVAASVREFLVPVELYALGRLAATAGVSFPIVARWFLAISAVAALFTVGLYVLLPATFWNSTLDLLRFIREVQGIPSALSLWAASLVGHFGVGAGVVDAQFSRAVGPFTHPVGTAHYFVVPLVLAAAAAISRIRGEGSLGVRMLGWTLVALFALAVITPISRAAWMAAVVGLLLAGLLLNRVRTAVVVVVAFVAFVVFVPPFSYSIQSAVSLTDSSAKGHVQAITEGVGTIVDNPLGLGAGHGDTLGEVYGAGESAGIGESMYLATAVTAGPVGLVALVIWMLGVVWALLTARSSRVPRWWYAGLAALTIGLLIASALASPLMRFTTAASLWLLVGLAIGSIERREPLPSWRQLRDRIRWRSAQAKMAGSSTR
jgi:hypothetical protein